MAIQYYSIANTGKKYALDKATGVAQEISSIPTGGATINWGGSSLPSELTTGLSKSTSTYSTTGGTSTSTSISTDQLPPIPDELYQTAKGYVQSGQMTPDQARQYLQRYIGGGIYSGSVDTNKLFPPGESFTRNGVTYAFDKTGTGTTVTTNRPVEQTTVTKEGITTSNVDNTRKTNDASLAEVLNNPNLTPDQKNMIQQIYDAVSNNDVDTANKLSAAMKSAIEFSNPYFKAQVRLATDALERGITAQEGDLAFKEKQLNNILQDTLSDVASAKGYLSFQETQQLNDLARKKKQELDTTAEQMAALGKTSSSVRTKKEQLIKDVNQGLVESTTRAFSEKQTGLTNQASRLSRDTQQNIDRYKELAAAGKLDLLRSTEEKVGSTNLGNLGVSDLLGNITGSITQNQAKDALSFASNFVF